jgi:hypothetical protein
MCISMIVSIRMSVSVCVGMYVQVEFPDRTARSIQPQDLAPLVNADVFEIHHRPVPVCVSVCVIV